MRYCSNDLNNTVSGLPQGNSLFFYLRISHSNVYILMKSDVLSAYFDLMSVRIPMKILWFDGEKKESMEVKRKNERSKADRACRVIIIWTVEHLQNREFHLDAAGRRMRGELSIHNA